MNRTSLRRKVAQLLIVRASGYTYDSQRLYPERELSNAELVSIIE